MPCTMLFRNDLDSTIRTVPSRSIRISFTSSSRDSTERTKFAKCSKETSTSLLKPSVMESSWPQVCIPLHLSSLIRALKPETVNTNSFRFPRPSTQLFRITYQKTLTSISLVLLIASGVMMRWKLGLEYACRTELFATALVRNQFGQYEGSVSKVVACVGFLVHFYVAAGLMRCARSSSLFRHLGFASWSTMPTGGTSVAMIYATMAGLTESSGGRLHWTFCTEALPIQHRSPLTEVLHVQMALGCCLSKDDPIPDWATLTGSPEEPESVLRGRLYRSIIAISDSIEHAPQFLYTRHAQAQAVLRQILNGCRALAAFWQGKLEESLEYATRTIHNILTVDRDILGVWVLIANSFAVQIAIVFVNRELFKLGMSYIAEAGLGFPITHRLLTRLSEQFTHAEHESTRYQMIGNSTYAFPLSGMSPTGASLLGSSPTSPGNLSSPLASPSSPHALSHLTSGTGSYPSSPVTLSGAAHSWSGMANAANSFSTPMLVSGSSPINSNALGSASGAPNQGGSFASHMLSGVPFTPMNPQSPNDQLLHTNPTPFTLEHALARHTGLQYYSKQ